MASPAAAGLKLSARVMVQGKDFKGKGTVAFIGNPSFAPGQWIGVILDDPKGKNNGIVDGKQYFTCPDNHGMFVRSKQLQVLHEAAPSSAEKSKRRQSGIRPPVAKGRSFGSARQKKPGDQHEMSSSASSTGLQLKSPSPHSSSDSLSMKPPRSEKASRTKASTESLKKPEGRRSVSGSTDSLASEKKTKAEEPASVPEVDVTPSKELIVERANMMRQEEELEELRSANADLEEKLQTLKSKRIEDREKLKEAEKLKIELQKLREYKNRSQENQSALQKELQQQKNLFTELQEDYDRYRDETADVQETVEMATLDKEMAEEKCDSLQQENESMKDKLEETTLELDLMKAEMESGATAASDSYQIKQLEQQIVRLKEALVKLRDLSNTDKAENQRLKKEVDTWTQEANALGREKENYKKQLDDLSTEMIELKEQVDASLGAEEMVEKLTERNLQMEEQLTNIEDERRELEELCETNNALLEGAREQELDLREEVDKARTLILEERRKRDLMSEQMADYENTILQFRERVSRLQEDLSDLRAGGEVNQKTETVSIEQVDFKAKFAETKAFAKTIELELRHLEAEQSRKHVTFLLAFMPPKFTDRGSDHDAVSVLLLVPRIVKKANILSSQLKNKFSLSEPICSDDVFKTSRAEQMSHGYQLIFTLDKLRGCLQQYEAILSRCNVDLFLKVGTLLSEMMAHEKALDHLIALLQKDQLDETISLAPLEKATAFYQQLYDVHLNREPLDYGTLLTNTVHVLTTAVDCLSIDLQRAKLLLEEGARVSNISNLFDAVRSDGEKLHGCLKRIRRYIQSEKRPRLDLTKEMSDFIHRSINDVALVTSFMHQLCKVSMTQPSVLTEGAGISDGKMEELAHSTSEAIYGKDNQGPFNDLRSSMSSINGFISTLADSVETGALDSKTDEIVMETPIQQRAAAVRQELASFEHFKQIVDAKDEELKELSKQLRMKHEQLGEQQVRLGKMEKRVEVASRDSDGRAQQVQRKLDEVTNQLKAKEKEFGETYDALQSDIDALEQEKGQLKAQMNQLQKRQLIEGLTAAHYSSASAGGMAVFSSREGEALASEVTSLRELVRQLSKENFRIRSSNAKKILSELPPLKVPRKPVGLESTTGLMKLGEIGDPKLREVSQKLNKLQKEYLFAFTKCPVVDITSKSATQRWFRDEAIRTTRKKDLAKEIHKLQVEVKELEKERGLTATQKIDNEVKKSVPVGTLTLPAMGHGGVKALDLTSSQLNSVHQILLS